MEARRPCVTAIRPEINGDKYRLYTSLGVFERVDGYVVRETYGRVLYELLKASTEETEIEAPLTDNALMRIKRHCRR